MTGVTGTGSAGAGGGIDTAGLVARSGLDATGSIGTPASDPEYRFDVERTVGLLATALAQLHELALPTHAPTAGGVSRYDPDTIVEQVRSAHSDGLLSTAALSGPYRHMPPERLVEILESTRRSNALVPAGGMVMTHGRPSLSQLRCHGGALVGLVEWEDAGLGDPYRDLAVASRSVATELGPTLVPLLFDQYAAERRGAGGRFDRPDPLRLDWYVLAAELTP